MTGKLNRGEGTAGKLLTDDALYKRMDSLTARLDTVLQNLNNGEGTAGQLLHDKQLYENMNQTIIGDARADRGDQEGSEEIPERESQHLLRHDMAKDNSGSVMVAFVVGALTGAAVALLFAPASGEETREYLGREGARRPARPKRGPGPDY